jgi:predicted phosphohydrolase
MTVWALSDPHLSFGVADKSMDVFGPSWDNHADQIAREWKRVIGPDDLVLIPGDISWAVKLEDAIPDLEWIHALPGTKVLLRGNHDYWWSSNAKMAKVMPPSIHFIQNNVFNWHDLTIGGARLWDSEEYGFNAFIEFKERADRPAKIKTPQELEAQKEEDRKIFARELERLKLSLQQLNPKARLRIALTHYPPISADLQPSITSKILEDYKIDICVFGHLHSVRKGTEFFGTARGVKYVFASCDFLDFKPIRVL